MAGGAISLVAVLASLVRFGHRPQPHQPSGRLIRTSAILLIGLAATVLVWGYALRFNLQITANTTPNLLRFGLPTSAWWLFAIAILIGMMSFALTGVTAAAWWFRLWSLPRRVFYTLVCLAAAIFCGMLANWDLFTVLFR